MDVVDIAVYETLSEAVINRDVMEHRDIHESARRPGREAQAETIEVRIGFLHDAGGAQHLHGGAEAEPVPGHEHLELDGRRARPFGVHGWTPLAPHRAPLVEQMSRDDGAKIGGETRTSLEAAERLVVVLDQLELDGAQQFLHFVVAQSMVARHAPHNLPKQGEILGQEATRIGWRGRDARIMRSDGPQAQEPDSRTRWD